jgi:hypothetical protein
MLRKFKLPAILMGLALALSPATALAQRGGGHMGGGHGFGGGGQFGGGFHGGQFHGGGLGRGFGHFEGGRHFVSPGFGFGFYGSPGFYYGTPYYYPPSYYGFCSPAGYYDAWGVFHYYPGCY